MWYPGEASLLVVSLLVAHMLAWAYMCEAWLSTLICPSSLQWLSGYPSSVCKAPSQPRMKSSPSYFQDFTEQCRREAEISCTI